MQGRKYSDRHPGGDARRRTNGDRMRVSQGIKALVATAFTGGLVASALAVAPAGAGAASTSNAPGVTSNSITVGTISTQTGPIASNFSSLIYGEKAYYQYINAQGGVNGRKIDYKYALGRRRQPDHVQPAGQHAHQPGPRVRGDRSGNGLLLAQPLRRVGHPDLRLQRDRQLGRPAEPVRRRRFGAVLPG